MVVYIYEYPFRGCVIIYGKDLSVCPMMVRMTMVSLPIFGQNVRVRITLTIIDQEPYRE
jgi:hypothetical protein